MRYRCLTNNPYIIKQFKEQVEPFEGSPLELFMNVRTEIRKGFKLLTHPLTGAIGPYINPYKSVILDAQKSALDADSLHLIEQAIAHTKGLLGDHAGCVWDAKSKLDFQYLDYDFVKRFFEGEISF